MDFTSWIKDATDKGYAAIAHASGVAGAGVGYLSSAIGQTWMFGSTESSNSYDDQPVDEKHYFLVPDRRTEVGFALYSMRCLPDGVPPINDLPKRRLFHLPNEHALPTVESIMLEDAREGVDDAPSPNSIGSRLNDLANQIDQADSRLFNGVLLIGGLVAIVNPVAGAAIAVKALIPSIGLMLSKYGLQYAGDIANSREVDVQIGKAEKDVQQKFRKSDVNSIVNPLLVQLEQALNTSEEQYDPLLEFSPTQMAFGDRDRDRLFDLTCQAISNVYQEVIDDPSQWESASLGPEDIRYLKLIVDLARDGDSS